MASCQRFPEQAHLGGGLVAARQLERAQRDLVLQFGALDGVSQVLEVIGARDGRGGRQDHGQQKGSGGGQ